MGTRTSLDQEQGQCILSIHIPPSSMRNSLQPLPSQNRAEIELHRHRRAIPSRVHGTYRNSPADASSGRAGETAPTLNQETC